MEYYTITKTGLGEYEEKKSRFLGEAIPVSSEEEAAKELSRIRKQYYDARHHCYAYVLGESRDRKKASDDGEPQGTAGLPILKVIEGETCTNTLVVVTRYFGGTLLGTGGLVRAYTNAAKAALAAAAPVCMQEGEVLELCMEYGMLDPVRYLLEKESIQTRDIQYTDKVRQQIVVPAPKTGLLQQKVQELSGGKIAVNLVEKGYFGFKMKSIQS